MQLSSWISKTNFCSEFLRTKLYQFPKSVPCRKWAIRFWVMYNEEVSIDTAINCTLASQIIWTAEDTDLELLCPMRWMLKGNQQFMKIFCTFSTPKKNKQNAVIALRALTSTSLQSTVCLQMERKGKMPCGEEFGESLQMVDSPTMRLMCSQLCALDVVTAVLMKRKGC